MNAPTALTLSQLANKVSEVINHTFRSLSFWVIGDITNHTYKSQTNYHYFDLVEKDSKSNSLLAKFCCKSWGEGSLKIIEFEQKTGQRFQNNINILVNVRVIYHPTYGLQLELNDIDPNYTIGVLEQKKQETLQKLVRDNHFIEKVGDQYITRNNQLSLARVIQNIAVISAKTSAGLQDFKHTLENNPYSYKFAVKEYYADVQGDKNYQSIINAFVEIFNSKIPFDAVVIIRGGGAQTDFLIFDNYFVAKAVAKFPIPIITGIGHQKNETISDLMAHTKTKTPTQAAEFIISHIKDFADEISLFQKAIIIRSQQLLAKENKRISILNSSIVNNSKELLDHQNLSLSRTKQEIERSSQSIIYRSRNTINLLSNKISITPTLLVSRNQQILSNIAKNLKTSSSNFIRTQIQQLEHFKTIFRLMSPQQILQKGFAIVKREGNIISDAEAIKEQEDLTIIFSEKEITTTVKSKKDYNGTEFNI